ncbi:DUF3037 domain-containing protein [Ligilactobacillus acidipiscis]|uniref:DUF3037 domain-containing protein n=1 Tax=Ligilactobacillus acidipiscis TaxID=89059 RepID=UPI0022E36160|nr:DUF3037 domain-containing protein [Ligilactobacillus acidipiscis]
MAERQSFWYSIVTYIPSSIRYERINVGIILGNKLGGQIVYNFLSSKNKKLRYFLWNKLEKKQFDTTIEFLSFLLNKINSQPNFFSIPNSNSTSWAEWLGSSIPKTISFSDVHIARSENAEMVFDSLIETYIGSQFLDTKTNTSPLKTGINEFFKSKELLDNKLKTNIKVQPSKDLPFKVEMDYAFLKEQGGQPHFLELAPKESSVIDWYKSNATLLTKSSRSFGLSLIIDQKEYSNKNSKLAPLVNDLCSDKKVRPVFIESINNSSELLELSDNIQTAIDTAEWNSKDILIA